MKDETHLGYDNQPTACNEPWPGESRVQNPLTPLTEERRPYCSRCLAKLARAALKHGMDTIRLDAERELREG